METDFSKIFYEKYFNSKDRNVKITLGNGTIIKGIIAGFFKGDENFNEPYIIEWHIVEKESNKNPGYDAAGFMLGMTVKQRDIAQIEFLEDHSVLKAER